MGGNSGSGGRQIACFIDSVYFCPERTAAVAEGLIGGGVNAFASLAPDTCPVGS